MAELTQAVIVPTDRLTSFTSYGWVHTAIKAILGTDIHVDKRVRPNFAVGPDHSIYMSMTGCADHFNILKCDREGKKVCHWRITQRPWLTTHLRVGVSCDVVWASTGQKAAILKQGRPLRWRSPQVTLALPPRFRSNAAADEQYHLIYRTIILADGRVASVPSYSGNNRCHLTRIGYGLPDRLVYLCQVDECVYVCAVDITPVSEGVTEAPIQAICKLGPPFITIHRIIHFWYQEEDRFMIGVLTGDERGYAHQLLTLTMRLNWSPQYHHLFTPEKRRLIKQWFLLCHRRGELCRDLILGVAARIAQA